MFFPGSRYSKLASYQTTGPDGTLVQATRLPLPGPVVVVGYLRRGKVQRLDQIAARFLGDATAFWRVCDANGAVVPDALAARDMVGIPIDAQVTA
jgi:hypothetical protein